VRLHRLVDPLIRLALAFRRPRRPADGVLVIASGGLGDTVMLAVVLPRFLDLARPGERVAVMLRKDAARMAFVFPRQVEVLTVDHSRLRDPATRWRVGRDLRDAGWRLVVNADYLRHPDLDEFLVAACGAPEAVAMEPRPSAKHGRRLAANRRLYTRLFDSGPPVQDKVVRWARFAEFLTGRALPAPVMTLPRPHPATPDAPIVVLQPFSAVALKQRPPATWEAVVRALPPGWKAVLAGHPSDLDKNPGFRPLLDLPNLEFEGAPFKDLAAIIAGARLVVSVDTACMHLAAALGTPTLCLASAAYVGEIVPYAPEIMPANLTVLYQPMDCQGCLGTCVHPPEGGMYPCVARLDTDRIVAAVRAMTTG
jgi:ADP-heptose:LPS heptosyltransferase